MNDGHKAGTPTWWLVFSREMADQWIGGKALTLILVYSILLGIVSFVTASNSELSIIPPKEMVFEMLKLCISVGAIISLIIAADSLSGERERSTLESLLLTPASRRQIVVGKFLAAISPWPVAWAMTIPYWRVLAQGDEVFRQAVLWGGVMGSIWASALAGLGMIVSLWSSTNKTSYFVALGTYVVFLIPAQLPGRAQTGVAGQFLQKWSPMAATNHFLAKILVNNRTLEEFWTWMSSPVLLVFLVLLFLFWYAGPRLRLEGGVAARIRRAPAAGLFVIAALAGLLAAAPALAQDASADAQHPLKISVNMAYKVLRAGDKIEFKTVVTNTDTEASPPVAVSMNIINLDAKGDPVDPEDWSPQRSQYVDTIPPGGSATLSWRINAILDGDFMVYMVAIPEPEGPEATSQIAASSGIHLTVEPFTNLNPSGVLPYAIGGPIVLLAAIFLFNRLRNRGVDAGGAK